MPVRTTPAAVKAVLLGDYDTDNSPDLTGFILKASLIVGRVIICGTRKGITVSDEEAEVLERWVAAHLYTAPDKPLASKSSGGSSGSFQGQTGMGFEATRYGQDAMNFDPTGCLRNIDKQQTARGVSLGKPYSEQRSWDERN